VFQPAKLRAPGVMEQLQEWQPDLIVVAAYGKILPAAMLVLPPLGCLNVHASLLPKYRGAAPIQWAIANGEAETGVTIMRISEEMDAGDILLQQSIPIAADETGGSLHDKLARLGAEALGTALTLLKQDQLCACAQNQTEVTYAPLLKKENGRIDWRHSAIAIERQIRAFNPWPSAYTTLHGKLLKIFAAQVEESREGETQISSTLAAPGTVIKVNPHTLRIATGAGGLVPTDVQLEGKKRLEVKDFLKGCPVTSGVVLGA
jgi:methionyl-tRNA formyltransferase